MIQLNAQSMNVLMRKVSARNVKSMSFHRLMVAHVKKISALKILGLSKTMENAKNVLLTNSQTQTPRREAAKIWYAIQVMAMSSNT